MNKYGWLEYLQTSKHHNLNQETKPDRVTITVSQSAKCWGTCWVGRGEEMKIHPSDPPLMDVHVIPKNENRNVTVVVALEYKRQYFPFKCSQQSCDFYSRRRWQRNKGEKQALAWKSEIWALVGYSHLFSSKRIFSDGLLLYIRWLQRPSRPTNLLNKEKYMLCQDWGQPPTIEEWRQFQDSFMLEQVGLLFAAVVEEVICFTSVDSAV